MTDQACRLSHVTPAGGENLPGIQIEDNQHRDCFSIRYYDPEEHDGPGAADLIHFCDWPALRDAIDSHQAERHVGLTRADQPEPMTPEARWQALKDYLEDFAREFEVNARADRAAGVFRDRKGRDAQDILDKMLELEAGK
jgi:hypothetical protein